MSEWCLPQRQPPVWSAEYHFGRERAAHLEEAEHGERLRFTAAMIQAATVEHYQYERSFSDLGCGDGGLLSLVQGSFDAAWGYDFCPANAQGWSERGVVAASLDVFGWQRPCVRVGEFVAMTEVLEHLEDPHGTLRWLFLNSHVLIASSPWNETDRAYTSEHAWAWDVDGYRKLIEDAGYTVHEHEKIGLSQIIVATAS